MSPINSKFSATVGRVIYSSVNMSSSTALTGRSFNSFRLGLSSQHRPVNFPWARSSEYSASRSGLWYCVRSKAVYPVFYGRKHFRSTRNIRRKPFFSRVLNICPTQITNSVDEQCYSMQATFTSLVFIKVYLESKFK